MEKVLLTVEEAAERLSLGRTKVYELVARGELPSVVIGRCRRVPVQALEPFVERLLGRDEYPSAILGEGWSRTPPGGHGSPP